MEDWVVRMLCRYGERVLAGHREYGEVSFRHAESRSLRDKHPTGSGLGTEARRRPRPEVDQRERGLESGNKATAGRNCWGESES